MKKLVGRARIIAPHLVPVLLLGESGTGKELFARAIHNSSPRKSKPFVSINCGAIPENLFESELFGHIKGAFTDAGNAKDGYLKTAKGGTLFLDEIGEMPLNIQSKLLRVLQEKEFCPVGTSTAVSADIRVISATNRNLLVEISNGTFREDLYHRIAVGILHLPPLREREGDVGLLIDHLMDAINDEYKADSLAYTAKKVSVGARSSLMKHSWPGNVRELENSLKRAAIWSTGDVIDKQEIEDAMLPVLKENRSTDTILDRPLHSEFDLKEVMGEVARHYLELALKESGGNKTKAAKALNFKNYQAMDLWLKKYEVA
jgi:transcriptional regulator with PAS, ATPase and Fis domain